MFAKITLVIRENAEKAVKAEVNVLGISKFVIWQWVVRIWHLKSGQEIKIVCGEPRFQLAPKVWQYRIETYCLKS